MNRNPQEPTYPLKCKATTLSVLCGTPPHKSTGTELRRKLQKLFKTEAYYEEVTCQMCVRNTK